MTEYFIIRNAYKAPNRRVFDFLSVESLRSPNEKQQELIAGICDGVEFFSAHNNENAKKRMRHGDHLYQVNHGGDTSSLICVHPPKK